MMMMMMMMILVLTKPFIRSLASAGFATDNIQLIVAYFVS